MHVIKCNSWTTEKHSYNIANGDGYIQYSGHKYNCWHGLWFPSVDAKGYSTLWCLGEMTGDDDGINFGGTDICTVCHWINVNGDNPCCDITAFDSFNMLAGNVHIKNPDKGITLKIYNLYME